MKKGEPSAVRVLEHAERRNHTSICADPRGYVVATADGNFAGITTIYEIATGQVRRSLPSHPRFNPALFYSSEGDRILTSGDGSMAPEGPRRKAAAGTMFLSGPMRRSPHGLTTPLSSFIEVTRPSPGHGRPPSFLRPSKQALLACPLLLFPSYYR